MTEPTQPVQFGTAEFTFCGLRYRVRYLTTGAVVERFDGEKIGWSVTGSARLYVEARRLGLIKKDQ